MDFLNWEFAEAPAADAENRADYNVKYSDLDFYNEPFGQPSPTSDFTGSAMSGLSGDLDGYQSPWESISALEGPPSYIDCIWPMGYPPAPASSIATLPPIPHDLWSLDGSLSDFGSIDVADLSIGDSEVIGLGLSFSSDTVITPVTPLEPSVVTGSTPPSPIAVEPKLPPPQKLECVSEDDLPACLDQLCAVLRQHYPDSKPPGQLFKAFLYRKKDLTHCKLCTKALENREQMNQHVMKVHCGHLPFGCDELGCTHRAARMADLIKHKEKHGEASWNCPYCGNVLRNQRNLVRHIKNKHPEMHEPSRSRSHSIKTTGSK